MGVLRKSVPLVSVETIWLGERTMEWASLRNSSCSGGRVPFRLVRRELRALRISLIVGVRSDMTLLWWKPLRA